MDVGRTFKSLEEPPNYFGCHIHSALIAILVPVIALLGFMMLDFWPALIVFLGSLAFSATIFGVGAWLGKTDPFWVEAGQVQLLDEELYLDV